MPGRELLRHAHSQKVMPSAAPQSGGSLSASSIFLEPPEYDSGGRNTHSIAVAEVNGDGKPDLLVTNECVSSTNCAIGGVAVLLGNGDGTFQPAAIYGSGGMAAYSVAVADVNGDGKPDLLVANEDFSSSELDVGGVGVLLGNGDGTFQPATSYSSGGYFAVSVVVGDLNGDGKPDLLVGNRWAAAAACEYVQNVGVLLGNGDGTFQAAVSYSLGLGLATSDPSLAVADVNGDGVKLDLLALNGETSSVDVLLGNGDGTLRPMVSYFTNSYQNSSLAVADVDGDGTPDLLVASICGPNINCTEYSAVSVLQNFAGDGTFPFGGNIFYSGGSAAVSVAVGDVNRRRQARPSGG